MRLFFLLAFVAACAASTPCDEDPMPLPNSRERTYADGIVIDPNDLNVMQDCIIGGKHGLVTLNSSVWGATTDGNWNMGIGDYLVSTGVSSRMVKPVPLITGARLVSVTADRYGDGVADLDISVVKYNNLTGSVVSLGLLSVPNPPAAWAHSTLDVTDYTLTSGDVLKLFLTATGANIRLDGLYWTFDVP